MISSALVALLQCPRCRSRVTSAADHSELNCAGCGACFHRSDNYLIAPRPDILAGRDTDYHTPALGAALAGREIGQPWLGAAVRQRWLARWLYEPPVGPVLDLGCGDGRFAYWNRQRAHVVGVDAAPLFARQALATVDLVQADARALPFGDGVFRAAYSIDVLEHLDLAGIDGVLSETYRVLTPGGRFFIFTNSREPSTFEPAISAQRWVSGALRRRAIGDFATDDLRKGDHVKALATFEDFVRVAARHGFVVRRQRFWNGLAQGWIDNVLLRIGEHLLLRHGRREPAPVTAGPPDPDDLVAARGASHRLQASRQPVIAGGLTVLTAAMQADVALFGRWRSGPFFALLERT